MGSSNGVSRSGMLAGLFLSMVGVSAVLAKEESLSLDQVSKPVMDAVEAKFPG